jgi:glycerophosphoryl diester phosphodiesterase
MGLYIEIKEYEFHRRHNLDPGYKLLETLRRHGYKNRSDPIFIQSFDSEILKYLRYELKTKLKIVQLIGENRWRSSNTDFNYIKTEKGMKEVSGYADGIGPWMNQLVKGVDFSGNAQIMDFVKIARQNDLLIHSYTFRSDRLPSYVSSFDELLDLFFIQIGVDGIFTDFPDKVVHYLDKKDIN